MQDSRLCPLQPSVYGYDDAFALVRAYVNGDVDPVTVARKCLDIARENPKVFITVTAERALREAEASRQRYQSGQPLSVLDGVPLGWKDLIDVAGTRTTAGSALFADSPSKAEDAPMCLSCARSGLVCIGKLNTTEFAYSGVGINEHFGTPANAFSKEEPLIPGGSSCGSGVAVGAGLLPLAVGTDTGGSVRIPSALNGIVGFKPSASRYNRAGLRFLSRSQDTPGPMGRSMRDIAALDAVMRAGAGFQEARKAPALEDICFVVDESFLSDPLIDADVKTAFESAAKRLEKAGAVVRRRLFQPFHDATAFIAGGGLSTAEIFSELKPILDDEAQASRIDKRVRKRAELARSFRPERVVLAYRTRSEMIAAACQDLKTAILLTPTVGHTAPPIKDLEENEEVFFKYIKLNPRLTGPASFMDMPAITMPVGLDTKGLPIGMTLSMGSGLDDLLLCFAVAAERALMYT